MEDWIEYRMGSLGDFVGGGTPSTEDPACWGGDIFWLVPSDISNYDSNFISETRSTITEKGLATSAAKMLPVGTLCMSSRATVGDCVIAKVPLATNQGFINVVCNEKVENEFLLYWIRQNKNYIHKYVAGTTFGEIGKSTFKKLKVFLPPLPEQRSIVTILSKVDEVIAATEASIVKAERVKKSLMQNLLTGKLKPDGTWRKKHEFQDTKIGKFPKEWQIMKVSDISTKVTDGEHATPDRVEKGNYLLSARNIRNGYLDLSDVDFVSDHVLSKIRKRCNPQQGDLFISCSGTIGNVCIVPHGLNCGLVRSVALVKLKQEMIEPEFAEILFQSHFMYIQMLVSVSSSVQGNLFQGAIRKLKVPYPNKKERDCIVENFKKLNKTIESKQVKIKKLERLKKALMQNLLTGKVRLKIAEIING